MDLKCEIRVGHSPYGDVIPDAKFNQLAMELVGYGAEIIEDAYKVGNVAQDSFSLCVLDPTAPLWKPSTDCVLITAAIGGKGRQYVRNAIAKAISTRDAGEEWGKVLYSQPHRIPGGAFRWGYAANVDSTIIGGSAQAEKDDQLVCTLVGAEFNSAVAEAFRQWSEDYPRQGADDSSHDWFTDSGGAPDWLQYHDMSFFDGNVGVIRLNF